MNSAARRIRAAQSHGMPATAGLRQIPKRAINQPLPHVGANPMLSRPKDSSGASPIQNQWVAKDLPPVANIDEIFDRMCGSISETPLNTAIESAMREAFDVETTCLWIVDSEHKIFYSPSKSKVVGFGRSLVAVCVDRRDVFACERPGMNGAVDLQVDVADVAGLYIPIGANNGPVKAVIQIVASKRRPKWSDGDSAMAQKTKKKFSYYSGLLFRDTDAMGLNALCATNQASNVFVSLVGELKRFFKCRHVDVFAGTDDGTCKILQENGAFTQHEGGTGVASFVLANQTPLIAKDVLATPGYDAAVDGTVAESVIALPCLAEGGQRATLVLRGKDRGQEFSGTDLAYLSGVTPVVSRALCANGEGEGKASGGDSVLSEKLRALLEVAEILSGVLDVDVLILTIMEKACSLLNTERCSLFLVDIEKQELVSCFQGGLDKRLRVPLNRGIVGHTATTGAVVNIPDPYNDPRFDQSFDVKTGFKTRTILCVPIFNNRGEIAGVTEMINKIDTVPFDEEDIKMLMAFNVFCGISLDNSKLYQSSLDLTRQLRSFVEMSSSLNTTNTVKDVLEGILGNATSVIHASRATVYLYDVDSQELNEFVSIGDNSVDTNMFARQAIQAREMKTFTKDDVIAEMNLDAAEEGDSQASKLSRINSALDCSNENLRSTNSARVDGGPKNLVAFPLMTSDGRILGVMELTCSWKIMNEDFKLLDCFAVFAAVSLEKSELQEIATNGLIESNVKHWMAQNERRAYTIPEKLKLSEEHRGMVFSINFDAPLFDGTGHFKVIWAIFDSFNLLSTFGITNEKLFKFLTAISETYKKVPYHNWRHAVDVTQFIQYEVKVAKFQDILTSKELFGLMVAGICHDANHDGFTNAFNEKAETPLGILFKNQSVMETHHCSIAIGIISKEDCNIFSSLESDEYKAMWTMIIGLILATDMAKHFSFLKAANDQLDKGPLDMQDHAHRMMAIDLILKCADISNVSRPFEMANKWCDVLCEEFFRQGDLETTHGMEYTSPLNDRAHLDKAKSQIGFYTFVCLPLYETTARAVSALQVNVEQVKSNLAVWKAAQEESANAQ